MGSKSSSTPTSNATNYSDSRSVADAGGGILGNANQWDQSVNLLDAADNSQRYDGSTTNTDNSTRTNTDSGNTAWDWNASTNNSGNTAWDWNASTNNSSNQADSSTRTNTDSGNTAWNWDASNRSTTTLSNTSTDGGAFGLVTDVSKAQTSAARDIALAAFDASQRYSPSACHLSAKP